MRRHSLLAICLIILCAGRTESADPRKPNILLIMTDDQGYGDFSIHGNKDLQTPNIDQFAKDGIQFERFYVSPLCAPTRASLLTGRYSLRTGVWGVTHSKEAMRPEEVTIAEALKAKGYRTGLFGKWHNGEQFPYTPPGQGFDDFFGFHNGHWNNYHDADLLRGTKFVPTKGYIADVLTDEAIAFMDANQSRPFFCYVPFNTPHSPYQVPEKYFKALKAKGLSDELIAVYGMCMNIDENVGRLLEKVKDLSLRKHTIVLFLTDNGANGDRFNAGMRGRKGSLHEGGSRVPLFFQWPGHFDKPRTIKQICAHIDIMPTLLDLCGLSKPDGVSFDGRSLVPLLEGKEIQWQERLLFTHNTGSGREPGPSPGAVRSERYRAVIENKGGWQLYDMVEDPGQTTDLAKTKPEVLQPMTAAYDAWFKDVSKAGFQRFPLPIGHAEENPVTLHAPQAHFSGGVYFFAKNGFANDWLTGWTSKDDRIWWEIDVARAGKYESNLQFLCPETDAGSMIKLSAGDASLSAKVPATPIKEIPLKHYLQGKSNTYRSMEWKELPLGRLELPKGKTKLTLEAASIAGKHVMDVKGIILRRVD